MRIGIVQYAAITGNVEANVQAHIRHAKLAASKGAELIVFPELSLTGYEPPLAALLATDRDDPIFQPLEDLALELNITICAGMPLKAGEGINISMILFRPNNIREVYSKQFLHQDELPFFKSSPFMTTSLQKENIALAICYEISIPAHSHEAAANHANIYIASVVKYPRAMKTSYQQLSEIARKHRMLVLMSNAVGLSEGVICGGLSAIWNEKGKLLAQLNDSQEAALIIDTATRNISSVLFD